MVVTKDNKMGKMFLNEKGYVALAQSVVDWNKRNRIVSESIGKTITEENEAFYIDNKRLFRMNGKDCALCRVYAEAVCVGCPLRDDRAQYTIIYKKLIAHLRGDTAKGIVSINSLKAMTNWSDYLFNTLNRYTDKILISKN